LMLKDATISSHCRRSSVNPVWRHRFNADYPLLEDGALKLFRLGIPGMAMGERMTAELVTACHEGGRSLTEAFNSPPTGVDAIVVTGREREMPLRFQTIMAMELPGNRR